MTLDEMIEVLNAAKRGERIECRTYDKALWKHIDDPHFNFERLEYRVAPKPEPKLVAHYPAVYWDKTNNTKWITSYLYHDAEHLELKNINCFIRLATEYPPIMLPVEE